MKYAIRALKYFAYITVIMTIILALLVAVGFVSSDINEMFSNGWKSVRMILIMFALVSAFYPRFGYGSRMVHVTGEYSSLRGRVVSIMEERGYKLESEEGTTMTFRSKSAAVRIARMWEDRITIEHGLGGFTLEGIARDVSRITSAMDYKFNCPED